MTCVRHRLCGGGGAGRHGLCERAGAGDGGNGVLVGLEDLAGLADLEDLFVWVML